MATEGGLETRRGRVDVRLGHEGSERPSSEEVGVIGRPDDSELGLKSESKSKSKSTSARVGAGGCGNENEMSVNVRWKESGDGIA